MNELDDTDLVSRSFLTVFFLDVNNLKDALTGYRSIILRLKLSTGADPKEMLKGLDETMKNAVIQWSDNVRHNVERCHVAAKSLEAVIDGIETKKLDSYYDKIIDQFAPDIETVSLYTFEINRIFVKSTIEKILNKLEVFYDKFSPK